MPAVISKKENYRTNAAAAVILLSVMAAFLSAAGRSEAIPFALTGPTVFLSLYYLSENFDKRKRLIAAAAAAAILALILAVLFRHIGAGTAGVMNGIFENAENSRKYVYDKYSAGDGAGTAAVRIAAAWAGAAAGAVMALIPRWSTIWGGLLVFITENIFFAYYGIDPPALWLLLSLAALVLMMAGGSITAVWPLLLAGVIIASAVVIADPGKNSAVSKADESLRDRFASRTIAFEGEGVTETGIEEEQEEGGGGSDTDEQDNDEPLHLNRKIWIVAILVLITGLILFVPSVIHDRLEKKRMANRAGIDSEDDAEAVRSMFLYAVRWLYAGGLTLRNVPYDEYDRDICEFTSEEYSDRYSDMMTLWKEAAYSDHRIGKEERDSMKEFMDSTIKMVKDKSDFKDKLKIRFSLAL